MKLSQASLGERIVPAVTQGAVARWEDATPQRPALPAAVQVQHITQGEVPATLWGYTREQVAALTGGSPRADEPRTDGAKAVA